MAENLLPEGWEIECNPDCEPDIYTLDDDDEDYNVVPIDPEELRAWLDTPLSGEPLKIAGKPYHRHNQNLGRPKTIGEMLWNLKVYDVIFIHRIVVLGGGEIYLGFDT